MPLRLIVVCAGMLFMAVTGTAFAEDPTIRYYLYIDCKHSEIDNTASDNTIRIQYLDKLGHELTDQWPDFDGTARLIKVDSCRINVLGSLFAPWEDNYEGRFDARVGDDAAVLRLSIQGSDAFFIDQMKLTKANEEHDVMEAAWRKHWGANNGHGYCLSTDRKDGDTDWKDYVDDRGCVPCLDFFLDESNRTGSSAECSTVGIWYNPKQGVCRDNSGNFPSWDGEFHVTDAICAQTCNQNAGCEAYSWDSTRNYCQYFGISFSRPSNVGNAGPITMGHMSQPNFTCRIKG